MQQSALLALEDGSIFHGQSIGIDGKAVGEVIFNTAITGYQEILTDPSYFHQIVSLTQPHIGNVGVNDEDVESGQVFATGLVIRNLPVRHHSWRSSDSLGAYLKHHKVVAIADVDTRRLTRIISKTGAQRACIITGECDIQDAINTARDFEGLIGADLARLVSTQQSYEWNQGCWSLGKGFSRQPSTATHLHVIVYDFGVKRNILRILFDLGCRLTVVPAETPATEVLSEKPDGVFLSNGPGDPEPCEYAVEAIREILAAQVPLFGICLGQQLLALAGGAKTVKMPFGHHGANHPVQDIVSKRVLITSQNHNFAVDEESLPEILLPTHRSLFDGSLQGIRHRDLPAFGFQGHPEGGPGPHDVHYLFKNFIHSMEAR